MLKKKIHEFVGSLTSPAFTFSDTLKVKMLKLTGRPIHIKPTCLNHRVELRSWLEFKILRSIVERNSYSLGKQKIRPKTIIDAGANLGFSAIYFASRYPSAKICAIEPDTQNFQQLVRHCRPYSNVTCVNAALCSSERKVRIANPSDRLDAYQVTDADETASDWVEGITVDTILERMRWDTISLMKVDIEGSEEDVFGSGSESWIEKVEVFAIEVHDSAEIQASKSVFGALATLNGGYRLRPKGENLMVENLGFSAGNFASELSGSARDAG